MMILFQYPSQYQIDSIYTGYIDSLDMLILFLWPQQYRCTESLLYYDTFKIREKYPYIHNIYYPVLIYMQFIL